VLSQSYFSGALAPRIEVLLDSVGLISYTSAQRPAFARRAAPRRAAARAQQNRPFVV
jgi:hypothetical protein